MHKVRLFTQLWRRSLMSHKMNLSCLLNWKIMACYPGQNSYGAKDTHTSMFLQIL